MVKALAVCARSLDHTRGGRTQLVTALACRIPEESEDRLELIEVDLEWSRRQEKHRLEAAEEDLVEVAKPHRLGVLELVGLVQDQEIVGRESLADQRSSCRTERLI